MPGIIILIFYTLLNTNYINMLNYLRLTKTAKYVLNHKSYH